MHDLIVIGGGFWGVAAVVQAREAGVDTLLLDDAHPQGASRNAAGIMSLDWYKFQRKTRIYTPTITNLMGSLFAYSDAAYGVEWFQERGLAGFTGEDYRSAGGQPQFRRDCYLLNNLDAFLSQGQAQSARVQRVAPIHRGWMVFTPDTKYKTRHLILATGSFTDALLLASGLPALGVEALRGRALVYRTNRRFAVPMTYKASVGQQYTFRQWGEGYVRLGDTTERGDNSGALDKLRAYAQTELPQGQEAQVLDGLRPVAKQMIVQVVAPGLVVATGGHRVGLALAPAAARKALALLGVE